MKWRVGDRVEAKIADVDWMPAVVTQVGGGPWKELPYLVEFGNKIGGFQPRRWLDDARIRAVKPPAAPSAAGPRLGRYIVLSYGNPAYPPIPLGRIELLEGGAYRYYNGGGSLLGEGKYAFDGAVSAVQWQSGPLQGQGGAFTVEREGKTHQIRLKASAIAANSTDSR
jgi:hypothetical protein